MKRSEDFEGYVRTLRQQMPRYNNGRKVVVLSAHTKRGQYIIVDASRCEGVTLRDVYGSWSDTKQEAYNEAFEMYRNTPNSTAFRICGHNHNVFTVSWVADNIVYYLTHVTEYIVVCDE